ncbi:ABC transporter ATP-binding protein [Bacteriovorax sp. DB6_IX]|uniref:ABC transporter ATP-binding protein n=1 Tax=Bacteriovorax sp. DB6_IX TaxID=1353530 RepID=UPI00038A48C9|nr:ABC transporter ATP-binding protein [Bacteriovorax sp. DB6_IX]EQC49987.1 ABC transporter, ATP-binding protein [Bacteriovorax sp. DB6_IX]
MSFIDAVDVTKTFGKNHVLNKVNFHLESGSKCVIKGASGSGKSTFLYIVGGLERLSGGKIHVGQHDLTRMNDDQLASYRNEEVGFVFQFHFLLSSLSNLENILLPARLGKKNVAEIEAYARNLAKRLGVEECLKKFPFEISGGQQQRINLIRALSMKPSLLLCDEPTGNLDSANSEIVTELLLELSEKQGTTLLVVTHDEEVSTHFKTVYHMVDGVLSQ